MNNTAFDEGGAIAFVGQYLTNVLVRNNTFYGNTARGDQRKGTYTADGFDGGGAIEVDTKAVVTFENNTIVKNTALKGTATSGNAGGGISVYGSGKATLRNNIISGNESTYSYSGGYPDIYPAITSTSWTSKTGTNIIGEPLINIFGSQSPMAVKKLEIRDGTEQMKITTALSKQYRYCRMTRAWQTYCRAVLPTIQSITLL